MDRTETEGKDKNNNNQSSMFDSKKLIVLPKSDLLSRVGAFLPQIQKANQGKLGTFSSVILGYKKQKNIGCLADSHHLHIARFVLASL